MFGNMCLYMRNVMCMEVYPFTNIIIYYLFHLLHSSSFFVSDRWWVWLFVVYETLNVKNSINRMLKDVLTLIFNDPVRLKSALVDPT